MRKVRPPRCRISGPSLTVPPWRSQSWVGVETVEKEELTVYGLDMRAATTFCVPLWVLPNRYSCPLMVATVGSSIQEELSCPL